MTSFRLRRTALFAAMLLAMGYAHADIPATAPYNTDPSDVHVQDQTSQGLAQLNTVLCVSGATNPSAMVNAGPYIALVDLDKCTPRTSSSASSGGGNSAAVQTNYATAVVNVTRATNSDPMVAKAWLSYTDSSGNPIALYSYLSATSSPTDVPPYGVFRLDYIAKAGPGTVFNGSVQTTNGTISFLENGSSSSNTALAMTTPSANSGAGTMQFGGGITGLPQATFDFAYDSAHFHRNDGTNDVCFDRSAADATSVVWDYGTYSAADGSRVDMTSHPAMPLLATQGSTTYPGWGDYYSISFDGLNIPDGTPVSGIKVSDQRPGQTAIYDLNKVGGQLTRWDKKSVTLADLSGVPLMTPFSVDQLLSGATLTAASAALTAAGASSAPGFYLIWDNTNSVFSVIGYQSCTGPNDALTCVIQSFGPYAVDPALLANVPLIASSNALGAQITIPATGAAHAGSDPEFYYVQSKVPAGSAALTLYCLNNCVTPAGIAAFVAGTQNVPFDPNTAAQQNAPDLAHTDSYTFDGALLNYAGAPVTMETGPSGMVAMTGNLYTTPFTNAACIDTTLPPGTLCAPQNAVTYYSWSTGPDTWNQNLWLSTSGTPYLFDAPLSVPYAIPSNPAYGSYSGTTYFLYYSGFRQLWNIPGYCMDTTTNQPAGCNGATIVYVPEFSIPDGTALTLPAYGSTPATPILVKALTGMVLLKETPGACGGIPLTPQTLPTGGLHDPSASSDTLYLGTKPTVTGAPKVIDGVVQN